MPTSPAAPSTKRKSITVSPPSSLDLSNTDYTSDDDMSVSRHQAGKKTRTALPRKTDFTASTKPDYITTSPTRPAASGSVPTSSLPKPFRAAIIRDRLSQISQLLDDSAADEDATNQELNDLRESEKKNEEVIDRLKRQNTLNLNELDAERAKWKLGLEDTQAVIEATRSIAEKENRDLRSKLESVLEERSDWDKEREGLKKEIKDLTKDNRSLRAIVDHAEAAMRGIEEWKKTRDMGTSE